MIYLCRYTFKGADIFFLGIDIASGRHPTRERCGTEPVAVATGAAPIQTEDGAGIPRLATALRGGTGAGPVRLRRTAPAAAISSPIMSRFRGEYPGTLCPSAVLLFARGFRTDQFDMLSKWLDTVVSSLNADRQHRWGEASPLVVLPCSEFQSGR